MSKFIAVFCLIALPFLALAQDRNVILAKGDKLPVVKVGAVVRLVESGIAGTSIKAKVDGDAAKLDRTTRVANFVNGKPLIGGTTVEFEFVAEKQGKATITIDIAPPNGAARAKTFELVVE
jgi:hypothetical protein